MKRGLVQIRVGRWAVCTVLGLCACLPAALGQKGTTPTLPTPGSIPLVNVGGGPMEAQFARLDFTQMILDDQNRGDRNKKDRERQKQLVDSGTVSALDLAAPTKAVNEFNDASAAMRAQHPQEAIAHLQKAIAKYPNFVAAHNGLGLAYIDLDDTAHAQTEFETAERLDEKFPGSYLNLGKLALSQNNFPAAGTHLEKAAALLPSDPSVLTALAYAQNGNHQYQQAIQTAGRVHELQHKGMGNVHYVAAVAAVALNDLPVAQRELALFLQEDPANPLAPTARSNLDILVAHQHQVEQAAHSATQQSPAMLAANHPPDLANSDRLKAQLAGVGAETASDACTDCAGPNATANAGPGTASIADADIPALGPPDQWTIRKVVDEVAVFFGVTSGGHSVSDLVAGDIIIRDDSKPPEKVLQFAPQSKLPMRLGLLIDTSGSVQPRFSFEKKAAAKFLQEMLSSNSDLGFVMGFANKPAVTQDFTSDQAKLASGIDQLTNAGGTALFDAVSFACWKLAAYPERERVAKVLVVVTDGEDNSSHTSLRQSIQEAEATGVTIYTISTKEGGGLKTEADKVLQTLAERSGGEALFPGDMGTLGKSFDKLRDQIRSRYLIAYKPADFEPNGKYRTITIIAEKNGKRLQVHARKGYHARIETSTP
jgi:Ca-activated chloride channel family protein